MYTLSNLLVVITLLFVAVNLFISFRMRREVQKNLKLAERRERFLREEQERMEFQREERQMLIEDLKQCCQGGGDGSSWSNAQKERTLEG